MYKQFHVLQSKHI